MKVLVDKMPKKPKDCPHARETDNPERTQYRCIYNAGCFDYGEICENTSKCPYFMSVKDTDHRG